MDWRTLFFSFRGRINRAKYWLALLVITIVEIIVGLMRLAIWESLGGRFVVGLVGFVGGLAFFAATLAVGIKRLHDRGKSAWWLLLFYLAPGVLAAIAVGIGYSASLTYGMAAASLSLLFRFSILVAFAIGIWGFVEIGCLRGTVGYNRFGPDPLARASTGSARTRSLDAERAV